MRRNLFTTARLALALCIVAGGAAAQNAPRPAAGSGHTSGVNVLLQDGSVRFVRSGSGSAGKAIVSPPPGSAAPAPTQPVDLIVEPRNREGALAGEKKTTRR